MDESLQFDRAELTKAAAACSACKTTLSDHYFEANGQVICGPCADGVRNLMAGRGSSLGRFTRALLFGAGVGVLCSIAYYAFVKVTHIEFALLTIFIGMFVGRAVRKGSGGRGGWRYQLLAAGLTYVSLVGIYIPDIVGEFRKEHGKSETTTAVAKHTAPAKDSKNSADSALIEKRDDDSKAEADDAAVSTIPKPLAWVIAIAGLLVIAMAAPIFAGFENILGLLIIGFGVWQAWRVNRRISIEVTGPHALGMPGTPPLPTAGA